MTCLRINLRTMTVNQALPSIIFQMTLHTRGHSYDVPRVVHDVTKRSFIHLSLYKQKAVLL